MGQNEEKSTFHVDDGMGERTEHNKRKHNRIQYNTIENKNNGNLSLQVTIVRVLEKKPHFKTLTMAIFFSFTTRKKKIFDMVNLSVRYFNIFAEIGREKSSFT